MEIFHFLDAKGQSYESISHARVLPKWFTISLPLSDFCDPSF
jgi:hypothetical protein